jgi:molybdopterin-guanine dinucleotide biosynthesis protein A
MRLSAVVLAGGESQRFGADKLAAHLGGLTLLEQAVADLPEDAELIIVGPDRAIRRSARFVREEPHGTGPAAALIAGLRTAISSKPDAIVVLPGDSPRAGRAAMALLAELDTGDSTAVMATESSGRLNPLHLALRPEAAEYLVALAGESAGAGQSAKRLVEPLNAGLVALSSHELFDIDTTDQMVIWQQRSDYGQNASIF